jgi:hypothetical protein
MAPQSGRRILLLLAAALLLFAIVGFLIGHNPHERVEATREASARVGSLDYPSASGWERASGAPMVPGLSITQPLELAPHAKSSSAGLIVGQLARDSVPLPVSFLSLLREPPTTEVVFLLNTQAYRYSHLAVAGYDRTLTLYVIPNASSGKTAIACYASPAFLLYMRECERIAATFITFDPASEEVLDLTPDVRYAGQVRAAVERVDELRDTLRPGMGTAAAASTVQRLATRLGDGVANVAKSLSAVEAPLPASAAHATLVEALWRESGAYLGFAAAAASESSVKYAAARTQVYYAEGRINAALEDLSLLGYN